MPNFMQISQKIRAYTCGPTEMMELTDALRDCANAPKMTA